jgi:ABC-2 type transport system permease protein
MKLMVTMVPVVTIAYLLFDFGIWTLGAALAAFFANLVIMSWTLGLVSTGAVLRYGLGAENFTWLMTFLMLPLSCVYYPVTILPDWLEPVALALPSTYVFEGLRAVVLEGQLRPDLMVRALALNGLYLVAGVALFRALLESARRAGSLVHMGE